MDRPFEHSMTPSRQHDERAREDAVRALRYHVYSKVSQGTRALFTNVLAPSFEKRTGRALEDRAEVRDVMEQHSYTKFHLSLQRSIQEVMWNTVVEVVERQLPEMITTAREIDQAHRDCGSLVLDPTLDEPRYVTGIDIHCMPGGYCTQTMDDDVAAGAIYDRGISMYNRGTEGGLGLSVAHHVKRHFPDLDPRRILDMGCTIGHATTRYCEEFPKARVDAIDVGAACLRYGHARAQSLGHAVHFSQQNAEHTSFEDDTFDLVVSTILAHETSTSAWPNIVKESYRILKPGGIMVHADLPQFAQVDPYTRFLFGNETHHNNEPFWNKFRELDLLQIAIDAGFEPEEIDIGIADNYDQGGFTNTKLEGKAASKGFGWGVQVARKSAR